MGNTIRREPVNFNIPASPDYKFLNITNFRGLDISSNPFELATNTASDCLNVYVDETNTLTTRPRLEKKELKDGSGKDILPLVGRCVGIYPLHDGYLFHWSHQMKILHGDKLTDVLVETMPLTPCKCFEQGDKIYLLGEGRYMVIEETGSLGVLNDVEGYVPNRSIVRLDGTEEFAEPLNLLSQNYLKTYVWDGINDPFGETVVYEQRTTNKAIKKSKIMTDLSDYELVQFYYDKTCLLLNKKTRYLYYGVLYNNLSEINLQNTSIYVDEGSQIKSACIGKTIVIVNIKSNYTKYYWYTGFGSWEFVSTGGNLIYTNDKLWGVSPQGTCAWSVNGWFDNTANLSKTDIGLMPISATGHGNPFSWTTSLQSTPLGVLYSNEQKTKFPVIWVEKNNQTNTCSLWAPEPKDLDDVYDYTAVKVFDYYKTNDAMGFITEDGRLYYDYFSTELNDIVVIYDLFTGEHKKLLFPVNFIKTFFRISTGKNIAYWLDDSSEHNLFVAPLNNPEKYYNTGVKINGAVVFNNEFETIVTESDNNLFDLYYWDESNPVITVLCSISGENDNEYDAWYKNREQLLRSTLFTRFDNNYWFASGNTYFRTQNNDPTYFPIAEYSKLGDSNEDITGFNIANDTTLLAYKSDRLYLIQPFYSETTGMTEYSITESKNTVGNTAIDAPIVTTLTEIPLQINNDGVYGLSQVSNVSAVERIADLMSEPINDRWLNEDDEVIKKAQTLNRLYWTYIILPYTKESKVDPRDVCKVYLLDNRTNSWYYWELPITLLNAFAKDNHAEFVDTEGNIYYLTTTDIRNMGFDTQLVTEYYDYGKKLIPWLWQSQVLYLGTMNHAKRLVNTTFILTDTDTQDGYGLQYSFKVFRKLASSVPEKELSGDLNLVRSTTKKTNISKFGFLQLKLSNITENSQGTEAEKAYRNNKLRLVGLGLKYVLLEGLIR